ncbi:MAG: exodeoxyribonuclease VII large subunit [Rubrivivax sp.]|nr:exodeoxyribonuclease VII large subunit [Rubrivivax sp.]
MWSTQVACLLALRVFEAGSSTDSRPVWRVAALLVAAGDALGARFGALAVRGELSGFTRAASGHCYFSLKDADGAPALLRCAMFRRAAGLLAFAPTDGQQVDVRGRLALYEPRGELQFVVEAMQRVGSGSLYEEFLRLRARLQAAGLFDESRKRRPARMPRRLGIVTSLQAAALRDVLTSLARRAPHVQVHIYPAQVQGAEAPLSLAGALKAAGERAEVDTLLLVRGGGSLEDLWAFNDERVVRAVADCPLPVICGVGHETDVTLSDLAADLRAPTPTAAAELATGARDDEERRLRADGEALQRALRRRLDTQAQRLDTLALRLGRPARALAVQQQGLQRAAQRLNAAMQARRQAAQQALPAWAGRLHRAVAVCLHDEDRQLQAQARRLQALDPHQVLARGYAWVESAQGRPVTSVAALQAGQTVHGVWADGRAELEVGVVRPSRP